MDKQTFAQSMQVAGDYYGKDLTPDVLKIYYEELGGLTVRELDEAIRLHIRTMKSFPQVAHLKPTNPQSSRDLRKPQHHEHPEWRKHWEGAERLMRAKLTGKPAITNETYLFPLAPLIEAAHESAQKLEGIYEDETDNEKVRESAAYGNLNVLLARQFS